MYMSARVAQAQAQRRLGVTYLQFTSLPVFLSITMSRTQGGGVMGRRSWTLVSYVLT